jgi:hypothetical protein
VQHPTIRTVQLSDISLDPANLRRHPVRNLEAIKASLRRFGQQKPIVVDAKGVIIAGNGVYTAARELGWKQIACVDSSLAGVERVAYAIADNQTPLLAEWDEPALLDTLEAMEPGEAETLGFSREDITLYREVDIPNAKDFYAAIWPCILSHCESNAALYCWHAHSRARDLQNAWDTNGVLTHQFIVWVKPNSVPGRSCWFWRHEPALMGWLQGNRPRVNAYYECTAWEVDAGDLSMLNTDDLRRLVQEHSDVWQTGWENGAARPSNNEHPTQKPLEIFARPMRKHTLIGDVVLEPFSGSGSQLIAAEKLRRRCRAIELQPVFVDVAVRRWQRETGRDARLADGRTWREVAKARGVRLGPDDTPLDVQAPRVVEPKPNRGKHQPCPPDSPSSAAVADAAASPMATPPTAKSTRGKRGKAAGATPTPAPPIVDTGATGEPSAAAS